jgi:alkylation response protein AidB-like acyl-CoA dehydrogenase
MTEIDQLLESVAEIAPIIREHASEAEQCRRLSRPVVEAMLEANLYDMSRPKSLGGLELDPVSIFKVVEEVARQDAAAGWNLQLALAVHPLPAWLPDAGAAEMLDNHANVILGSSFTPTGKALPVDGGYRLTGQWPFVSGAFDCDWFMFLPFIEDGDSPRPDDQRMPSQYFMWLPAKEATILDTWHTMGMRGTGSHDVVVSDIFIPKQRTAPMAPRERTGSAYQGALYRLTIWFGVALLGPPALGIARAAIDDLVEMAHKKTPSFTGSSLSKRQVAQRQVAEAEAALGAGRAYLYRTFEDVWAEVVQGRALTQEQKLNMQLATTHAIVCAANAVDLVHAAAGASSIRNEYRFQQYFRDVHTITQHAHASASRYESVGALMLGEESDWDFFAF